jgi:putative ABC transport system permease protein
VVGGIGVMNIMTVSVTERTREIGIRKSIGARTSSIMVQFLAEAAILTVIGGLIGLGLGVGLAFAATKIAEFPFVVHPEEVVVVVGISVFIGLFFGIAPARKAAKLNPIDALHTD